MKKIAALILFLATISIGFANPEGEKVSVNTDESIVTWNGYKVTGSHTGHVSVKEGYLEFTDGKLSGGEFSIDMTSITTTDLEGEWAAKLVGHLKSDDFFSAATYPAATLTITNVVSRGETGEYKIIADLTVKGITKPVKFNATVDREAGTASADIEIDRTEYDVRYGSGTFFDNLGDKTIYDEFDLSVELVF